MWIGVVLSAAAIFIFWVWSLSVLLSEAPGVNQRTETAEESFREIKDEMPGLWQSLGAGIGNILETVKEDVTAGALPSASLEPEVSAERLPIE